jgi:dihydroorotate dehydrogenase (NAD+) catalytic subunit
MEQVIVQPFYDPARSYQDNFNDGPFGLFVDPDVKVLSGEPQHTFLGHKVYEPFGIPAGPLLNSRFVNAALDMGFDIPVYKTVRTRKYESHPWPNVLAVKVDGDLTLDKTRLVASHDYSEPLSITNSFGVPSFDPDFWQPDIASAVTHARDGQVVVASYQGTKSDDGGVSGYIADFVLGARLLKETGVKAIEVNLSCPNEGTPNLLCFDVDRAGKIVEAIKNEIGNIPLIVKLAYFQNEELLEELLKAVGYSISATSSINTISAEIIDADGVQALPGEGRLRSGVCGHAIKWAGIGMTRKLFALREKLGQEFSIIGVGGVGSAADYLEYRDAGADAVMSATSAMWNPMLAREIKERAHEL